MQNIDIFCFPILSSSIYKSLLEVSTLAQDMVVFFVSFFLSVIWLHQGYVWTTTMRQHHSPDGNHSTTSSLNQRLPGAS